MRASAVDRDRANPQTAAATATDASAGRRPPAIASVAREMWHAMRGGLGSVVRPKRQA